MPSDSSEATVRSAVDRFLSSARCRNPNTRRAYAGVLDRLTERVGPGRRLDEVAAEEIVDALNELWGGAAGTTWTQRRSAVASWLAWSTNNGYRAACDARRGRAPPGGRRRDPGHRSSRD